MADQARLFVGGLAPRTRTEEIEAAFRPYGRCSVQIKSSAPGDTRGATCFAFVQYDSTRAAEDAIRNLSGRRIGARARPRRRPPRLCASGAART